MMSFSYLNKKLSVITEALFGEMCRSATLQQLPGNLGGGQEETGSQ